MAESTSDRKVLIPEGTYVIETKSGPVTLYYREDSDEIVVQGRYVMLVKPRAHNSVALAHRKEERGNG